MKQKIVIKVSMNDDKSRAKALRIVVSVPGFNSVELQGDDKNQIVIIGEGIDSTCLTSSIRKKVGHTEVVSITPIIAKKEEDKKKDEKKEPKSDQVPPIIYGYGPLPLYFSEVHDRHPDPCTIM